MNNKQKTIDKEIFFTDSQKNLNMISLLSGAYGTGKTFLTISLVHAFSLLKKRVLFFDADWGKYNVSSYLGLENNKSLNDVVYRNTTLNQIIARYEKAGFDVLAGNEQYSSLSTLPIGRLQLLADDLSLISRSYDDVFVDISSEKKKFSQLIAGNTKTNLLIISPNPQSLVGGYEIINQIKTQYPVNKIYIIVNQVNSQREGLMIYNTLAQSISRFANIEVPLIGIVRNDTRIRDCQHNQALLLSRYPTSDAAVDIMSNAKKLIEKE